MGFYNRVSQKVSDVIPVLWLMPIVTQPSAVYVFLSVAKCDRVCRAQTCAHSGRAIHFGQGVSTGWAKVQKNRILDHF